MNILKLAAEHPWAIQPSVLEAAIAANMEGQAAATRRPTPSQRAGAVAVIPLQGVLRQKGSTFMDELFGDGGGSTEQFAKNIRRLAADDSIGTIVIDVHSPGGEVFGTQEAADAVFESAKSKKIIAIANSLAASAAYWIASQASELIATPSSLTGSIGVFAMHEDISKMAEAAGVKVTFISAGKFKTEGNQFEPLSSEAEAAIQRTIDQHYSQFVASVARGRKVSQAAVRDGMGQGRVLTSKDALAAGMIDRIGTMQDVLGSLSVEPSGMMAMAEAEGELTSFGIEFEPEDRCRAFGDSNSGPVVCSLPLEHDGEHEWVAKQWAITPAGREELAVAAQHEIERERWEYAKLGA